MQENLHSLYQPSKGVLIAVLLIVFAIFGGIDLFLHQDRVGKLQQMHATDTTITEDVAPATVDTSVPILEATEVTSSEELVKRAEKQLTVPVVTETTDDTNSATSVRETNTSVASEVTEPVISEDTTSLKETRKAPVISFDEPIATFQNILGVEYAFQKDSHPTNFVFETLTPYSTTLQVDKYSAQKQGNTAYIYTIKKVDPKIESAFAFLDMLAEGPNKSQLVTIQNVDSFGKAGFYYNHLDKTERIRIVILSKNGETYAFDYPRSMHTEMLSILRTL